MYSTVLLFYYFYYICATSAHGIHAKTEQKM